MGGSPVSIKTAESIEIAEKRLRRENRPGAEQGLESKQGIPRQKIGR